MAGDGVGWGRCLHIRVSIDLARPLERGRTLNVGEKDYCVIFKYEKLLLFCFRCGYVIHGIKGCPVRSQKHVFEKECDRTTLGEGWVHGGAD